MQDNIHMDKVMATGRLQSFYFHNIRNQIHEKCTGVENVLFSDNHSFS